MQEVRVLDNCPSGDFRNEIAEALKEYRCSHIICPKLQYVRIFFLPLTAENAALYTVRDESRVGKYVSTTVVAFSHTGRQIYCLYQLFAK
jgi:hypothetical protein